MTKALFISTNRDGYAPSQCGKTLTVGELKELLDNYDDDEPVYFKNDNGYTYGSISEDDINGEYLESEEE